MNGPARLVIVRHVESERNVAKLGKVFFPDEASRSGVKGTPDHKIGITQKGLMQGEATSPFLRERFGVFDYVIHSGYVRTIRTTDALLSSYTEEERARMKIMQNLFIRERHAGHSYDMLKSEAEEHFSFLPEYWETCGRFFATPPGGESLAQVAERVYLFLDMVKREMAGKTILVTTHGGPIYGFRYNLENMSYEQIELCLSKDAPKNCGVTVYEYDRGEGRLVLKEYNTIYY